MSNTKTLEMIAERCKGEFSIGVIAPTRVGKSSFVSEFIKKKILPLVKDDFLKQKIVDEFSAVSGPALLALNPIAAGTGLNITAANHVIHYNLEWNPSKEDQASARAYRTGQTKTVVVHRLFYVDTIEEIINDMIQRKREISDTTIVGHIGDADSKEQLVYALSKSPYKDGE